MTLTRVAIVITRLDLGGAQEVALETAAGLDPARFDARLLAGPGGFLDATAKERLGERFVPVPALVHPIQPVDDLAALFWLWRYFRRERIEVVHTHSSKAGLLGRVAAWLAGVPRIVHTVHGWSFNDEQRSLLFRFYRGWERGLARITDVLAVVAQSCRDKGLLNGVGQAHQYALLRAAVDLPAWAGTPRSKQALNRALRALPSAPAPSAARPGGGLHRQLQGPEEPFGFCARGGLGAPAGAQGGLRLHRRRPPARERRSPGPGTGHRQPGALFGLAERSARPGRRL